MMMEIGCTQFYRNVGKSADLPCNPGNITMLSCADPAFKKINEGLWEMILSNVYIYSCNLGNSFLLCFELAFFWFLFKECCCSGSSLLLGSNLKERKMLFKKPSFFLVWWLLTFRYVQPTICNHKFPAEELAGGRGRKSSLGVTTCQAELSQEFSSETRVKQNRSR